MPKFTPKQRAYIRKRSKPRDLDPSEVVGELNIVPFLDIVMNLIMFLLATSEAVLLISQIESDLPKIAKGRSSGADVSTPLNLNVTVTDGGVIVSGSGGKLARGGARSRAHCSEEGRQVRLERPHGVRVARQAAVQ